MDQTSKKTRFLYNRGLAGVVLAAAIVLSILIGGGRGLKNARADVMQIYSNGVEGDGVGIRKDLSARFLAAEKLLTLAQKNDVDASALAEVLAAYSGQEDLSAAYEVNALLDAAVYPVYNALLNEQVSQADQKAAQSLYNEISSRGNMIKNDGYNASAAEFNDTLHSFPANLLAGIWGVDELELFR